MVFGDVIDAAVNDRVHAWRRSSGKRRSRAYTTWCRLTPPWRCTSIPPPGRGPGLPLLKRAPAPVAALWDRAEAFPAPPPRLVEIPVRYGGEAGPDLEEVASRCGLTPEEVVARHAAGGVPGLHAGLLAGVPLPGRAGPHHRRAPAGDAPDPGARGFGGHRGHADGHLSPGDARAAGRSSGGPRSACSIPAQETLPAPARRPPAVRAPSIRGLQAAPWSAMSLRVESPGLLTTRPGPGAHGATSTWACGAGGAMDEVSHRLANLLVGNPDGAATLEITLTGPTLLFETESTLIALCGAISLPEHRGPARFRCGGPCWCGAGSLLRFGSAGPGGPLLPGRGRRFPASRRSWAAPAPISPPASGASRAAPSRPGTAWRPGPCPGSTTRRSGSASSQGQPPLPGPWTGSRPGPGRWISSGPPPCASSQAPSGPCLTGESRHGLAGDRPSRWPPIRTAWASGCRGQGWPWTSPWRWFLREWPRAPSSFRPMVRSSSSWPTGRPPAAIRASARWPPWTCPRRPSSVPARPSGSTPVIPRRGPGVVLRREDRFRDLEKILADQRTEEVIPWPRPSTSTAIWAKVSAPGPWAGTRPSWIWSPAPTSPAASMRATPRPCCARSACAAAKGVALGAHPSLPDLQGFGRRTLAITPEEARGLILYQVGALEAFARAAGGRLRHVKPHGALYNMAAKDRSLAEAIAGAVRDFDPVPDPGGPERQRTDPGRPGPRPDVRQRSLRGPRLRAGRQPLPARRTRAP